jgi:hypothetical protein
VRHPSFSRDTHIKKSPNNGDFLCAYTLVLDSDPGLQNKRPLKGVFYFGGLLRGLYYLDSGFRWND